MNRIQAMARTSVPGLKGAHTELASIGLTIDKTGLMTIDSDKLSTAISKDAVAVGRLFAEVTKKTDPTASVETSGIADRMFKEMEELLKSGTGGIAIKEKGLRELIADIEARVLELEKKAGEFEKKTRERFSKLEAVLERIEGTGSVLDRQLEQIAGLTQGRNRFSRRSR